MKNPKSFFKKLKKLIEEECPENCRVVFSVSQPGLFVIKNGFVFQDNEKSLGGTSWHGVLAPVNCPTLSTGNVVESIVGELIEVDMEAVQS